jgi:hypothetical protein
MKHKALIFLAVRNGRMTVLKENLENLTRQLFDRLPGDRKWASALVSKEEDPYRYSSAPVRAYDATIELKLDSDTSGEALIGVVGGLADRLDAFIHTDLSALLIGIEHVFVPSEPTPIRFQYLMRRRADFSHADYIERYAGIHAKIGIKMNVSRGYVQFHANPELSRKAAASAGFGIWAIDSVAELHIISMDDFLKAASKEGSEEAGEDEEHFVDRPNSVMFISDEVLRLGDPGHR